MCARRELALGVLALALVAVGGATGVLGAANAVPGSRAGRYVTSIGPNNLKPSACTQTLTRVTIGVIGTGSAELLLGTSGADVMSAAGGADCVLGGGGNDAIGGGSGTDVCIGGPGTDTFTSCETQIQ